MKIIENITWGDGVEYIFEYMDSDSFDELEYSHCRQVYAVCLFNDRMVIGFRGAKKKWGLIGGTIEEGENFEQTLRREIQEESNMEIVNFIPLGYQKVTNTQDGSFIYQLRYLCSVRPFGPFISDPAGSITEITLIEPEEYRQYFDYGEIGERIVNRALELKNKL